MKMKLGILTCNRRTRSCGAAISVCSAWLLLAPLSLGKPGGIFVETGPLNIARHLHTATLLPNGKVLAAGGKGLSDVPLESAELYDPENETWAFTGALITARDSQIATLLPDGKVLVAGGFGAGGALASAELYDPATGMWSPTGQLGVARYYSTATLLPNGKVLVAGGTNLVNGALASAELYNPGTGIWTSTGPMVNVRASHTATLLPSGKVLVAGGFGPTGASRRGAEIYDPESGIWNATGDMVSDHIDHTATLLPNGKVLVAGANACCLMDAELYDASTGTWRGTTNLIMPRTQHKATLLENGKVLVVAGDDDGSILAGGELYDFESETWISTWNEPPPSRTHHTTTLLADGEVLVAGGTAGHGQVWASAQLYLSGSNGPSTILNLSTRLDILDGDEIAIAGFIIAGADPKTVLIRGLGPSLSDQGMLMDPEQKLYHGSTLLTRNDDWKWRPDGSSQQAEIEATTIPPANDLESAILTTLAPGAYTVTLSGKNDGTGMGLVEIYDLAQSATLLANISTRGYVDTDDNVMIGGLIIGGRAATGTARVIVRALGPSVPIGGTLTDPTLELRDGSGTLVDFNDNWKLRPDGSSQQADIEATGLAPTNDLESALVETLSEGNYTVIVRGINNTHGVGLVELYKLQ